MACPFERGLPSKSSYSPGDLLWMPRGLTAEQTLQKLPFVCHRILTAAPCTWSLEWLKSVHTTNVSFNNHDTAAAIADCIETCRQLLEAEETRPTGCDRFPKRMRH